MLSRVAPHFCSRMCVGVAEYVFPRQKEEAMSIVRQTCLEDKTCTIRQERTSSLDGATVKSCAIARLKFTIRLRWLCQVSWSDKATHVVHLEQIHMCHKVGFNETCDQGVVVEIGYLLGKLVLALTDEAIHNETKPLQLPGNVHGVVMLWQNLCASPCNLEMMGMYCQQRLQLICLGL